MDIKSEFSSLYSDDIFSDIPISKQSKNFIVTDTYEPSNNVSWHFKYSPKTINDLKNKNIGKIVEWLDEFYETKQKISTIVKKKKRNNTEKKGNLVIVGNHGSGKNTIIKLILEYRNIKCNNITSDDLQTQKWQYSDSSMKNLYPSIDNERNGVIINNIDILNTIASKTNIIAIIKANQTNYYFPIIVVVNNKHSKLSSEIKKKSVVININAPYNTELKSLLIKIITKEKINISDGCIDEIINYSQNDYRQLINILYDIKCIYDTEEITNSDVKNYFNNIRKKNIDNNLFDITKLIIYKYKSISQCLELYNFDKVLLPLMMNQYYSRIIVNSNMNKNKILETLFQIISYIKYGDIVDNYIYSLQYWSIQHIHGLYTCALPAYIIDKVFKNNKPSFRSSKQNIDLIRFEFPENLNRVSTKKIYKKNYSNISKCIPSDPIDFVHMNDLAKKMHSLGKKDEFIALLSDYNLSKQQVDTIIRINKLDK